MAGLHGIDCQWRDGISETRCREF